MRRYFARYLLVEPDDLALVSYREYTPPDDLDIRLSGTARCRTTLVSTLGALPGGEPDTSPLSLPADFLERKAVLLFLELRRKGCATAARTIATTRGRRHCDCAPLLVRVGDLDEIIAKANALGPAQPTGPCRGRHRGRASRAAEPADLRMPRYDVPHRSGFVPGRLAAFHTAFRSEQLAHATGKALSAAYQAFEPLLAPSFPSDPFAAFRPRSVFWTRPRHSSPGAFPAVLL